MNKRRLYFKREASRLLGERGCLGALVFSNIIITLLTVALICVCDNAADFIDGTVRGWLAGRSVVGASDVFFCLQAALLALFIVPLYIGQFWLAVRVCTEGYYRPLAGDIFLPFANRRRLARTYRCCWSYLWRTVTAAVTLLTMYKADHAVYNLLVGFKLNKTALALAFLFFTILIMLTAAVIILRILRIYPLLSLCHLFPDECVDSLVCRAIKISRGRAAEILAFTFSFAGIAMLSLISAGIVLFAYAAPFFNMTNAVFSVYLIESGRD